MFGNIKELLLIFCCDNDIVVFCFFLKNPYLEIHADIQNKII